MKKCTLTMSLPSLMRTRFCTKAVVQVRTFEVYSRKEQSFLTKGLDIAFLKIIRGKYVQFRSLIVCAIVPPNAISRKPIGNIPMCVVSLCGVSVFTLYKSENCVLERCKLKLLVPNPLKKIDF